MPEVPEYAERGTWAVAATNNGWPVVGSTAVTRAYYAGDRDGALVLKGDVQTAFGWLVQQIHTRVEPVTVVNGWRSAADNVAAGGAAGSNHQSGTALDINGHLHPYEAKLPASQRGTHYRSGWNSSQIAAIHQILSESGGLFSWGLSYGSGFRDAMHFDITKGRTAADVAKFVATITKETDMPLTPADIDAVQAAALKGVYALFQQAATRDTPTGRQFGDYVIAILDPLVTARTAAALDEKALADALATRGVTGVDPAAVAKAVGDLLAKRLVS